MTEPEERTSRLLFLKVSEFTKGASNTYFLMSIILICRCLSDIIDPSTNILHYHHHYHRHHHPHHHYHHHHHHHHHHRHRRRRHHRPHYHQNGGKNESKRFN